jgi:hypothetical protein
MINTILYDAAFKERFEAVSKLHINKLISKLLGLFETSEFHYCRATMHRYYLKYPKIAFDKAIASKILLTFFEGGAFSIFDFTKANASVQFPSLVTDSQSSDESSLSNLNWNTFFNELQSKYYDEFYYPLEIVCLFEDREPRNLKEQILVSEIKVRYADGFMPSKYSFFDIKGVLKVYERLIELYYPEYPLIKEVSTKRLKRYGHDIGNGMCLGFCVDYSILEAELKNSYLEFPSLKIEIFSIDLTHSISESVYLGGESDSPIARVNLFYFMGNFIHNRVGDSSDDSDWLQKKLCFYFAVNSFYTKIYLEEIAFLVAELYKHK